jgi:hypothetical protein
VQAACHVSWKAREPESHHACAAQPGRGAVLYCTVRPEENGSPAVVHRGKRLLPCNPKTGCANKGRAIAIAWGGLCMSSQRVITKREIESASAMRGASRQTSSLPARALDLNHCPLPTSLETLHCTIDKSTLFSPTSVSPTHRMPHRRPSLL